MWIFFNFIKVDTMEENAGIFIGKNSAASWSAHSKRQSSIKASDQVRIWNTKSILIDRDVLDTVIADNDYTPSITNNIKKKKKK